MTNHVPTLETCKRLKEAGFPQKTEFVWLSTGPTRRVSVEALETHRLPIECAAPILTEILELLPGFPNPEDQLVMTIGSYKGEVFYNIGYGGDLDVELTNPTESAAQLWLKVKEMNP